MKIIERTYNNDTIKILSEPNFFDNTKKDYYIMYEMRVFWIIKYWLYVTINHTNDPINNEIRYFDSLEYCEKFIKRNFNIE